MTQKTVEEIVGAFGLPEAPRTEIIAKTHVKQWMASDDIEALGALYAFIFKPEYAKRIKPDLNFDDYQQFILPYYDRCLREDPSGDWAHNRYAAGWDLANWYASLWNDTEIPRSALDRIKKWLEDLYKEADEELRECIVNAILEHLFEHKDIAKYFTDWKKDPKLAKAYADALEWSQDDPKRR